MQTLVNLGTILSSLLLTISIFLQLCFQGKKAFSSPIEKFFHTYFTIDAQSFFARFDLIYLILDKADEQTDRRLAKHIVALHFADPEVGCFPYFR